MNGFSAKSANKSNENTDQENTDYENTSEFPSDDSKLSDEVKKLNQLFKDGILTQEEFEKAKKKLLDD